MIWLGSSTKSHAHIDAVERFDFDIAEQVVEEVAEFVKDGFDLVVREQGGLARHRGRQVAADEAEVRLAIALAGRAARRS